MASKPAEVDHAEDRLTVALRRSTAAARRPLFRESCKRDLEGIVGKWMDGCYETDGVSTSWVKVRNPEYSQIAGRLELFEARSDHRRRRTRAWRAPALRLHVASHSL